MEGGIKIRVFVLCMCGSVLIWFMNKLSQKNYSQEISIPISIHYNDSLFVPTTTLPQSISVIAEGSGWTLLRNQFPATKPSALAYKIDNPLTVKYLNRDLLKSLLSNHIGDFTVKEVLADSLRVSFEVRESKEVVVLIDSMAIDLRPNFVVSSLINVTPRKVTFSGPASQIKKLGNKLFLTIPQRRISNNFDEKIDIQTPELPLLRPNVEKVMVSFEVGEILKTILSDSTFQSIPEKK